MNVTDKNGNLIGWIVVDDDGNVGFSVPAGVSVVVSVDRDGRTVFTPVKPG